MVKVSGRRSMVKTASEGNGGAKRGAALQGGMCTLQKVAIVKDDGRYSGVNTAAHEFGHLLGSPHDGYGDSKRCPESGGHLMSRYRQNSLAATFSECTKGIVGKFLA
ncbi:hypothetical protein V5799_033597, partial [Amblyomma americanum]